MERGEQAFRVVLAWVGWPDDIVEEMLRREPKLTDDQLMRHALDQFGAYYHPNMPELAVRH